MAIDLDPMPGVPFTQILDVARWVRDELDALGAFGVPKTSGAEGLHIYVPMPRNTPYETGLLVCQIVATIVAHKHPKVATVERAVKKRGKTVYVDYLQNILGKTLATAYSARASDYAGVSTPLTWQEVDAGVEREAFTIQTVPARLQEVGDLWEPLRRSKGIDLERIAASIPDPSIPDPRSLFPVLLFPVPCSLFPAPRPILSAMKIIAWCLSAALLAGGVALDAEDWPEFRGKGRLGIWTETGIIEKFPAAGCPSCGGRRSKPATRGRPSPTGASS